MRAVLAVAASLSLACSGAAAGGVESAGRSVAAIPLKKGYYVDSDTPCGRASNATTSLFKGDGFYTNCRTRSIEQLGPNRYRLRETCRDLQGGGVGDTEADLELHGDAALTLTRLGRAFPKRFCAQSEMPAPFRNNDLSDIIAD